jgi:hypothetical protein
MSLSSLFLPFSIDTSLQLVPGYTVLVLDTNILAVSNNDNAMTVAWSMS